MTWALAHWKPLSVAAGLALAFAAGKWTSRPPPAPTVHAVEDTASTRAVSERKAVVDSKGPEKITTVVEEFGSGTGPGALSEQPPRGARARPFQNSVAPAVPATEPLTRRTVTVEERGPEVITEHATEQTHETAQTHLDLTVTPQSPPSRAFQIGLEDPFGKRELRFAVRDGFKVPLLRLPLEVEVSHTPARGLLRGFGVGAAFKF